jgi:hypothetical protein
VGPELVLFSVIFVVVLIVATTGRWAGRGGGSTAGHYDPDAIGQYTLDPATMRYRYDLPSVAPSTAPGPPGAGPPHRTRRRKRPPDRTVG